MKRKLQKGFTLVELIVVMILMGLLMTCIVMVMRPSQNTFKNITNKAYEEQTALNISKLLNNSLRYSTGVKVICNGGTTPTAAEYGNFKSYIKLSNGYRTGSVKGARGDFERGNIEAGTFKRISSAITSQSFDEYDFQFSVPSYNPKEGEESMTLALRAMPMMEATADQVTVATGIAKPNPNFVPQTTKFYDYSETFELLNIRNKNTINKVTNGVYVEDYKRPPRTAGLSDDNVDFFNPKATPASFDNTIWILYTNPQQAEANSAASMTSGPASSSSTTSAVAPTSSSSSVLTPEPSSSTSSTPSSPSTPSTPTYALPDFNPDNTNLAGKDTQVDNITFTDDHSSATITVTADDAGFPSTADFTITVDSNGNYHIVINGDPDNIAGCFDPAVFPGAADGVDIQLTDEQKEYLEENYDVHPWKEGEPVPITPDPSTDNSSTDNSSTDNSSTDSPSTDDPTEPTTVSYGTVRIHIVGNSSVPAKTVLAGATGCTVSPSLPDMGAIPGDADSEFEFFFSSDNDSMYVSGLDKNINRTGADLKNSLGEEYWIFNGKNYGTDQAQALADLAAAGSGGPSMAIAAKKIEKVDTANNYTDEGQMPCITNAYYVIKVQNTGKTSINAFKLDFKGVKIDNLHLSVLSSSGITTNGGGSLTNSNFFGGTRDNSDGHGYVYLTPQSWNGTNADTVNIAPNGYIEFSVKLDISYPGVKGTDMTNLFENVIKLELSY